MKKLILLILPIFLLGDNLKSLLEHAMSHNNLIVSKTLSEKSKAKEVSSSQSAYYPTIDVGAFYQNLEERTPMMAGDTYSGYAKISFDIYDGGYKSSLLSQKRDELKSSSFDTSALKKSLTLEIVQDFFSIKNLNASLSARDDARKSLETQVKRIEQFYAAKVATKDDVDRLQAALDTNIYEIESIKFQILSTIKSLELKVGREVNTLGDSKFKELLTQEYESVDSIKSLMAKHRAILNSAESIDSIYYPKVRIEDTYSLYGYGDTDTQHPEGVDNQNKIMLSANMRLFDNATVFETKQAIVLNSKALNAEILYQNRTQSMQYELAKSRIHTSKIKIKSAWSALVSAKSAFATVEQKYNAGIVDNVVYLDALSAFTVAKALHETSLNDLEVAYAIYYYYSGKNIEEFLQ